MTSFQKTQTADKNKVEFKVTWHPFQLNPNWPRDDEVGVNKLKFYHEKFGKARADSFMPHLVNAGKGVWDYF